MNPSEVKNLSKTWDVGLKVDEESKTFIRYSNNMQDVYSGIDSKECSAKRYSFLVINTTLANPLRFRWNLLERI